MITMLRMTNIAGVILAGFFFILAIVHPAHNDRVEEFLNSPSMKEEYSKKKGDNAKCDGIQESVLMQQAKDFSQYLNRKLETQKPAQELEIEHTLPVIPSIKPNFEVICTSFCESNPDMSLALIQEPGKGRSWLKQSGKIGNFVIEKIGDGLVVAKNNETTFKKELAKRTETNPSGGMVSVHAMTFGQSQSQSILSASDNVAVSVVTAKSKVFAPTSNDALEDI